MPAAFSGPDAEARAADDLYERLALLPGSLDSLPSFNPYYSGSHLGRLRLALVLLGRRDVPADVRQRTLDGLLLDALFSGNGEAIASVVASGANPNARWCMPVGRPRQGERLEVDGRCTPENGVTPLMYAQSWARGAPKALLAAGADSTFRDWAGRTADDDGRLNLAAMSAAACVPDAGRLPEPKGGRDTASRVASRARFAAVSADRTPLVLAVMEDDPG